MNFGRVTGCLIFLLFEMGVSCEWNDYYCIDYLFDKKMNTFDSVYRRNHEVYIQNDSVFAVSQRQKVFGYYKLNRPNEFKFEVQKDRNSIRKFFKKLDDDRLDFDGYEYLYGSDLFIKIDSNESYYIVKYSSSRNKKITKSDDEPLFGVMAAYIPADKLYAKNAERNGYFLIGIGVISFNDLDLIGPSFGIGFGKLSESNIGFGGNVFAQFGSMSENDVEISILNVVATAGPVFSVTSKITQMLAIGISPVFVEVEDFSETKIKFAIGYVMATTMFGFDFHYVIDVGPSIKLLYSVI